MENEKKVYTWYLNLSIILSSLMILQGILEFVFPHYALQPGIGFQFTMLMSAIIFFWFIFNILMLIVMFIQKIERIALWLPVLYIFDMIFTTTITIIATLFFGMSLEEIEISPISIALGLLFPAITLWLAIKLAKRK